MNSRATGLLQIEDCLDSSGGVQLPPDTTLISLIDRNVENVGDALAYRYLDYSRAPDGLAVELTWKQFGVRWTPSARMCSRPHPVASEWRSWRRRASTTSQASSPR